jgi:hypothetical protein
MRKQPNAKRNGSALLLAVFAILLLLITGMGLLCLGRTNQIMAIRNASRIAARCAADASLTMALYEMNKNVQINLSNNSALPQATDQQLPYTGGYFSYTVTRDGAGGYIIESTGRSGYAEKTTYATVELTGPFESAIFAQNSISLKNSTSVDWYNYDADDKTFAVATNSTSAGAVSLMNSAIINGDAAVGPGANPDTVINLESGARITGRTYALTKRNQLSYVTVPGYLKLMTSQPTIKGGKTICNSGKYSGIDIKNSEKITIIGNVELYITGDITLGNSAEIEIADSNPKASLTVYLDGNFEGKNTSSLNNKTTDPKRLKIYGLDGCSSMVFKNSSKFYGAVHAPNANVIFDNSAAAYGAVTANNFEQKNSAPFYYDASLRNVNANDRLIRFTVQKWYED